MAGKSTRKPAARKPATRKSAAGKPAARKPAAGSPRLLSGGNPQIPKGYGDAPVRAYIAAMPGWKCDVGRRLDALITRTVPGVYKAVKYNTPFYGAPDPSAPASEEPDGPREWFLSFHCFDKYIKVTFFAGASLRPAPTVTSKYPAVRYFHIHENDTLDESQFTNWVKQASQLPGERL